MKIEMESHEFAALLSSVDERGAERGAAVEENRRLRDRIYDLEQQVRDAKHQLALPIPGQLQVEDLKLLIRGASTNNKIAAIKAVRSMLSLGLKEAKDLVDAEWGMSRY